MEYGGGRSCGVLRQIRRYGQRRDIQREGRLGVWSSDKILETKSWDTCEGPVCWGLGTGRQGKQANTWKCQRSRSGQLVLL